MIMLCGVLLTIPIGIALIVLYYFKRSFSYWKRHNLPTIEPNFPFGHIENPLRPKRSLGFCIKDGYDALKARGHKHGGLYFGPSPIYCPVDPEYVKNILQSDFDHFTERGRYFNERDDPLSAHLFNIGGKKWRDLRRKLTPTFTSGKMKNMFHTLVRCSEQLEEAIDRIYTEEEGIVNIKDFVSKFTVDIIGSCAFGLEFNSFTDPNSEFRLHGESIFGPPSLLNSLLMFLGNIKPELGHFLRARALPKADTDFFFDVIDRTVKFRESNGFVRNDMLQLMIALKDNKDTKCNDGKSLTNQEIAPQAMVFFLTGFETASTTMTYCFFELARHPTIQEKVRKEIFEIVGKDNDVKVSYESLTALKYLEQVIEETLRKYPIVPFITRQCTKKYKIPNSDTTIEKGIVSYIPILGLQRDEEFFPDPETFDPERFSERNRHKIRPFTYLPFGEGPRVCIGLRFAMMEVKLGLITLLKKYKFSINQKTRLPLNMKSKTILMFSDSDILLNAQKLV